MKKIKLVYKNPDVNAIKSGMDLYRLAMPYSCLSDEYDVTSCSIKEFDLNDCDADIYVINRPLLYMAQKVKKAGKVLICDIDDYWILPTWHPINPDNLKKQLDYAEKYPQYVNQDEVNAVRQSYNHEKIAPQQTIESAKLADIVTVTTLTLQGELAKIGINSVIVKNSIHPNLWHFTKEKQISNKMRFGWVGGVFHRRDVALMYEGLRRLHGDKEAKGKYQILSTFNTVSDYIEGEKMMTNNYQCCSPAYASYLKSYSRAGSHIGNTEAYKRLWNMDVSEYGVMYEQIHVALIPLQHGKFNSCKSELKLIEAGTTGCAAIVSDVMPYSPYLKHGYNCLTTEGSNGWYTAMKMLLNNPSLRDELAFNLERTIKENFDISVESNKLRHELNKL